MRLKYQAFIDSKVQKNTDEMTGGMFYKLVQQVFPGTFSGTAGAAACDGIYADMLKERREIDGTHTHPSKLPEAGARLGVRYAQILNVHTLHPNAPGTHQQSFSPGRHVGNITFREFYDLGLIHITKKVPGSHITITSQSHRNHIAITQERRRAATHTYRDVHTLRFTRCA